MSSVKFALQKSRQDNVAASDDPIMITEEDVYPSTDTLGGIDESNTLQTQKEIILAALNMCIDELSVLELLYKEIHIPHTEVVYETLYQRYGSEEEELERKQMYRIGDAYTNYKKLQKDILLLIDILKGTSSEICHQETFTYIKKSLETLDHLYDDDESILKTEAQNNKLMHDLKNEVVKIKKVGRQAIDEVTKRINIAQRQYDSVLAYEIEELKFVQKWENSRMEQKFMMLEKTENDYKDIIQNTVKKIRNENRVNFEISHCIASLEGEHRLEIEQWMSNYEYECEKRDEQIFQMRIDLENMKEDRIRIENLMEKRVKDMAEWIEYKNLKVMAKKRYILEFHSAFVIQRWWRRIMQIRGLGKWKKKKGKKGKDKKGKKKK